MADVSHLLEMMHPMREPPLPASLAPFLVTLGLGCVAAAALFVVYWQALRRRSDLRRSAEAALSASRALAPPERLAAQANLLRRLVRVVAGESEARRQGAAWLESLDRAFATQFFTEGDGKAYGDALYAPRLPDVDALDQALAGLFRVLGRPSVPAKRGRGTAEGGGGGAARTHRIAPLERA